MAQIARIKSVVFVRRPFTVRPSDDQSGARRSPAVFGRTIHPILATKPLTPVRNSTCVASQTLSGTVKGVSFAPIPIHFMTIPIGFASIPIDFATIPIHFVTIPIDFAAIPIDFVMIPIHFAALQIHLATEQTAWGAEEAGFAAGQIRFTRGQRSGVTFAVSAIVAAQPPGSVLLLVQILCSCADLRRCATQVLGTPRIVFRAKPPRSQRVRASRFSLLGVLRVPFAKAQGRPWRE